MATDALGRQLSDDGNYYWDGSSWQLVSAAGGDGGSSSGGYSGSSAGGDGPTSSQQSAATDAQGRPLSDDGNYYWDGSNWQPVTPQAEPDEDLSERLDNILKGVEVLNALKDAAEFWGLLESASAAGTATAGALLATDILSPILALLAGLYAILYADTAEERLAGVRGFAYGVMWGVLDKGTPTATCGQGANELFPGNAQGEQDKWNAGASEGVSKASDVSFKNHCLLWMAQNNDNGDQLLRHIAADAASHIVNDASSDDMFSGLNVDSPVC